MSLLSIYGMLTRVSFCLLLMLVSGCSKTPVANDFFGLISGIPSIEGAQEYLASPFVAAGDRVYMIGYQDGTFPDLGWHIAGEMGGIWDHPIKLLDGFTASLTVDGKTNSFCLDHATKFVNYPVGSRQYFRWEQEQLSVERFQFVPDGKEGMFVGFRIHNSGTKARKVVFSFTGMTDLRPTWLGDRTNMTDGEDVIAFDDHLRAFVAKDAKNPWYAAFGSSFTNEGHSIPAASCDSLTHQGSGKKGTLVFTLTLGPHDHEIIPIFIAGSSTSVGALRNTYKSLTAGIDSSLKAKIDHYVAIDRRSHVELPDKQLQQMYEWLKYNCEWLVRSVPEQGTGISAGLPDYPWWFGADMSYALQGVLATGDHTLAKKSILLLHKLSAKTNGNGRIIHEASTNGSVYNQGNVNETAQFINLLASYFAWTGDIDLIRGLFPDVKKSLHWLLETRDPDGNGYPNGSGMMEIPGLDTEMIDVAVYTQRALESAAVMARALGDSAVANAYYARAKALKGRINKEWWNTAAHSFGDFRATVKEARLVVDAAIVRADTLNKSWAVAELKETRKEFSRYSQDQTLPHVIYHNWVVNTPMETGLADPEKGREALMTARKFENPFGVFVTGIDRTTEPDSVVLKSRKKTFSYTGAVMTLPTGVLAVAAARYGKPEDALIYLQKLQRSFSYALPGSMYEVSPDFGMVTQAWNIYGVAVPIVNYFFGIEPEAYKKTVRLSPRLPASWTRASLEKVSVGNNTLSLSIKQEIDYKQYDILQSMPDWIVIVDIAGASRVILNNKEQNIKTAGDSLRVKGCEIHLQIYK